MSTPRAKAVRVVNSLAVYEHAKNNKNIKSTATTTIQNYTKMGKNYKVKIFLNLI